MTNLSIRGLDDATARRLKEVAQEKKISVNNHVLELIRQGLGISTKKPRYQVHHELDALAGTWTTEQAKELKDNISPFEQVDKDMWR